MGGGGRDSSTTQQPQCRHHRVYVIRQAMMRGRQLQLSPWYHAILQCLVLSPPLFLCILQWFLLRMQSCQPTFTSVVGAPVCS